MDHIRGIAFDIDGTLTRDESLLVIMRELGTDSSLVRYLWKAYGDRTLDREHARRSILTAWSSLRCVTRAQLQGICEGIDLRASARECVDYYGDAGFEICLISSSMDIYVRSIATRLGVDEYYANIDTVFDPDGRLIDIQFELNAAERKSAQLKEFCRSKSMKLSECVVVGNAANDIELFAECPNSVLVLCDENMNMSHRVRYCIEDLSELPILYPAAVDDSLSMSEE